MTNENVQPCQQFRDRVERLCSSLRRSYFKTGQQTQGTENIFHFEDGRKIVIHAIEHTDLPSSEVEKAKLYQCEIVASATILLTPDQTTLDQYVVKMIDHDSSLHHLCVSSNDYDETHLIKQCNRLFFPQLTPCKLFDCRFLFPDNLPQISDPTVVFGNGLSLNVFKLLQDQKQPNSEGSCFRLLHLWLDVCSSLLGCLSSPLTRDLLRNNTQDFSLTYDQASGYLSYKCSIIILVSAFLRFPTSFIYNVKPNHFTSDNEAQRFTDEVNRLSDKLKNNSIEEDLSKLDWIFPFANGNHWSKDQCIISVPALALLLLWVAKVNIKSLLHIEISPKYFQDILDDYSNVKPLFANVPYSLNWTVMLQYALGESVGRQVSESLPELTQYDRCLRRDPLAGNLAKKKQSSYTQALKSCVGDAFGVLVNVAILEFGCKSPDEEAMYEYNIIKFFRNNQYASLVLHLARLQSHESVNIATTNYDSIIEILIHLGSKIDPENFKVNPPVQIVFSQQAQQQHEKDFGPHLQMFANEETSDSLQFRNPKCFVYHLHGSVYSSSILTYAEREEPLIPEVLGNNWFTVGLGTLDDTTFEFVKKHKSIKIWSFQQDSKSNRDQYQLMKEPKFFYFQHRDDIPLACYYLILLCKENISSEVLCSTVNSWFNVDQDVLKLAQMDRINVDKNICTDFPTERVDISILSKKQLEFDTLHKILDKVSVFKYPVLGYSHNSFTKRIRSALSHPSMGNYWKVVAQIFKIDTTDRELIVPDWRDVPESVETYLEKYKAEFYEKLSKVVLQCHGLPHMVSFFNDCVSSESFGGKSCFDLSIDVDNDDKPTYISFTIQEDFSKTMEQLLTQLRETESDVLYTTSVIDIRYFHVSLHQFVDFLEKTHFWSVPDGFSELHLLIKNDQDQSSSNDIDLMKQSVLPFLSDPLASPFVSSYLKKLINDSKQTDSVLITTLLKFNEDVLSCISSAFHFPLPKEFRKFMDDSLDIKSIPSSMSEADLKSFVNFLSLFIKMLNSFHLKLKIKEFYNLAGDLEYLIDQLPSLCNPSLHSNHIVNRRDKTSENSAVSLRDQLVGRDHFKNMEMLKKFLRRLQKHFSIDEHKNKMLHKDLPEAAMKCHKEKKENEIENEKGEKRKSLHRYTVYSSNQVHQYYCTDGVVIKVVIQVENDLIA
ncbi:hypothetical protein P9112_010145 [Eukaryota sp. TZLM1-RC]